MHIRLTLQQDENSTARLTVSGDLHEDVEVEYSILSELFNRLAKAKRLDHTYQYEGIDGNVLTARLKISDFRKYDEIVHFTFLRRCRTQISNLTHVRRSTTDETGKVRWLTLIAFDTKEGWFKRAPTKLVPGFLVSVL
jgi:hypothetical protein